MLRPIACSKAFKHFREEIATMGGNVGGDVADWWGSCELASDFCGTLWKTHSNLDFGNDSSGNHRSSQATNLPISPKKQANTSVRSVIFSHTE